MNNRSFGLRSFSSLFDFSRPLVDLESGSDVLLIGQDMIRNFVGVHVAACCSSMTVKGHNAYDLFASQM